MQLNLTRSFFSLRQAACWFGDMILPCRCAGCGCILADDRGLCPDCWSNVVHISSPFCAICGIPFAFDVGEKAVCGQCYVQKPVYESIRSACVYTALAREIILRLKHGDQLELVHMLVDWLDRAGQEFFAEN